jgi:TATA-box binding protein (TBP) (component of TFIID and TFIIIB)
LLPKKQNTGKKKKRTNIFYNQVSMYVSVGGKIKPINIKLFLNGSIQITGCKNIYQAIDGINKIFTELKKDKVSIVINNNKLELVEHIFVSNYDILDVKNLYTIKIAMINSNFNIGFQIDRNKLYNVMVDANLEVSYDPENHACINLKYDNLINKSSIFIFEAGSIIITGARNCYQIIDAYNFINKYLLTNYINVIKYDFVTNDKVLDFIKKYNINK